MLQIVPIIELVGMCGREIERDDQQTPTHGILLLHDPEVDTGLRKRSCTKTSQSGDDDPKIKSSCSKAAADVAAYSDRAVGRC
jgi:hypothetical protein